VNPEPAGHLVAVRAAKRAPALGDPLESQDIDEERRCLVEIPHDVANMVDSRDNTW
jgi:hypothetical protein